jgi:hypothetical protein
LPRRNCSSSSKRSAPTSPASPSSRHRLWFTPAFSAPHCAPVSPRLKSSSASGATERVAEATKRLQDSGADETVTFLAAALEQITALSDAREELVAVIAA